MGLLTWESDSFAYAESFDEKAARYRGLRGGQVVTISAEDAGLLVKSTTARAQLDAEVVVPTPDTAKPGVMPTQSPATPGGLPTPTLLKPRILRRFHGTVVLDPARVGRDAGRVAEEVIAHLAGQPGAEVSVTLEIEVSLPGGANEQTVRVVTENSRALKFSSHGFEEE